jgi:hypothetical protein
MSVTRDGDVIRLVGICGVEDAEPLAALCRAAPGTAVDVTAAVQLHSAVVQALVEFRAVIGGVPADPFAAAWILPAVKRAILADGDVGKI